MPYIRQDVTFYRIRFAALTEKEGKRNAPINVNPVGGGGGVRARGGDLTNFKIF